MLLGIPKIYRRFDFKPCLKHAFTLLEVMVAIALLALVSGIVSFKTHGAIEKKKFQSDVERFKEKIIVAQRLALASQSDWSGILKKEKKGWVFSIQSENPNSKKVKPLHIKNLDIYLNGKKVKNQLTFDFFASGHTSPDGSVFFSSGSDQRTLKLATLFKREEGEKGGPEYPKNN